MAENNTETTSKAGADPDAPRHIQRKSRWQRRLGRWKRSAENALELLRKGHLAETYNAPYEVVHTGEHYRLRRYVTSAVEPTLGPILLVPPLMVTAEIYDVSPDTSAVTHLVHRGVDVWVVDFGAPEEEQGGMERTLDDHVLAVDDAISRMVAETGRDVHLAGYSQGGLFVYQTAAYRRSEGIASLITFGSPVDIRKNLPVRMHTDLVARAIQAARRAIEIPLNAIDGLPGSMTSRGFKVLSLGKEIGQIAQFFALLHDRTALEEREPRRRFLGGEGFVAWPGPALRAFVDEVIVGNRLASGGLVIAGRPITLADITAPVLYFLGQKDDFARPPSVRAIKELTAGPTVEFPLNAGHFGLVVGSRAMTITWPSVRQWLDWVDGGPEPDFVSKGREKRPREQSSPWDLLMEEAWERLGQASLSLSELFDTMRWQVPRLARLQALAADTPVGLGLTLDERAANDPDSPFFIWRGRAYSYNDANRRVDDVLKALLHFGARPGQHVGVAMSTRPNLLTVTGALSRLGAVPVLLNPEWDQETLSRACEDAGVTSLVARPERREHIRSAYEGTIWWIGRDSADVPNEPHVDVWLDAGGSKQELPADLERNPGQADELGMVVFTAGTTGQPKPCRITNRRWAIAAIGAAAACRLTPADTLYSVLPLHNALASLVVVGGALAGGTRLALSPDFGQANGEADVSPATRFWREVRRTGSTVVFYTGSMMKSLASAPVEANESRHPVRLFVGAGLSKDVWKAVEDRYGPERILEFYASTEGNTVIANIRGRKRGSIGRPINDMADVELLRLPLEGPPWACASDNEPGLLITRLRGGDDPDDEPARPLARFDGYVDSELTEQSIMRNVFEEGDVWFVTGDILKRDEDGDYWVVGRHET